LRTRFAPSPTGPLHLGHAFSAVCAHDLARTAGGDFLLRIEDIDQGRARPEWEALIYEDLRWLGLSWEEPVMRQSERMDAYGSALDALWSQGLLYPCTCTRRDIADALSAPQEGAGPAIGPDGPVYPGTCRAQDRSGPRPDGTVLRLDMAAATASLTDVRYSETGLEAGPRRASAEFLKQGVGDVVLCRRDMGTSYHLSVVVDDAAQDISNVVRGKDLSDATAIHVVLQMLLGLSTPDYHHHRLIRDETGKRLAKRDDARAIRKYREDGGKPDDILRLVGLIS